MKFRTTGILFIVFVLLAGYVFLVELRKKPAETVTDKSTWVLTLAADDVQQVVVSNKGESVLLLRSGDSWLLGGDGGQEADADRVNAVVTDLVNLKAARVLTQTAEALATYGLQDPTASVSVGQSSGHQDLLVFGDKNPQGSQYYAQRNGESPIYLLYASTVDDLLGLVSNLPIKPTPTPAAQPTPAPATVAPAATPKP